PFAHTGLALNAFQAGGNYAFNGAKHSDSVKRGLDWLVAHQNPDGALVSSASGGDGVLAMLQTTSNSYHQYYMYEHGIATFALAEACALAVAAEREPDPRYREAAQKAVRFIESQ